MNTDRIEATLDLLSLEEMREIRRWIDVFERWNVRADEAEERRRRILDRGLHAAFDWLIAAFVGRFTSEDNGGANFSRGSPFQISGLQRHGFSPTMQGVAVPEASDTESSKNPGAVIWKQDKYFGLVPAVTLGIAAPLTLVTNAVANTLAGAPAVTPGTFSSVWLTVPGACGIVPGKPKKKEERAHGACDALHRRVVLGLRGEIEHGTKIFESQHARVLERYANVEPFHDQGWRHAVGDPDQGRCRCSQPSRSAQSHH